MVTEKEFDSLPPRLQEQVRRYASSASGGGWQQYYSPPVAPTQFRRVGESSSLSIAARQRANAISTIV